MRFFCQTLLFPYDAYAFSRVFPAAKIMSIFSVGTSHEFPEPSELELLENVNERVRPSRAQTLIEPSSSFI